MDYITISAIKALVIYPLQIAMEFLTRWVLVAGVVLLGANLAGDDFILYTLLIATIWGISKPIPPLPYS